VSTDPNPVIITTCVSGRSWRISRRTWRPPTSGIRMSASTTSKGSERANFSASGPLSAVVTA
jgi:hypothetical protein